MASLTALRQVGQSFFPGMRLRLCGHCFARAEDISLKLFFIVFVGWRANGLEHCF